MEEGNSKRQELISISAKVEGDQVGKKQAGAREVRIVPQTMLR